MKDDRPHRTKYESAEYNRDRIPRTSLELDQTMAGPERTTGKNCLEQSLEHTWRPDQYLFSSDKQKENQL